MFVNVDSNNSSSNVFDKNFFPEHLFRSSPFINQPCHSQTLNSFNSTLPLSHPCQLKSTYICTYEYKNTYIPRYEHKDAYDHKYTLKHTIISMTNLISFILLIIRCFSPLPCFSIDRLRKILTFRPINYLH